MIQLRPYQQNAKDWLYAALRQHQSVVWVMPTGAGKRVCAVDVCLDGAQRDRSILIVTNRRLLVDQMARECQQHGVRFGVIMANYDRGDQGGPVQIASLQTLQSWFLKPRGITKEANHAGLPEANLIVIDEGHQNGEAYRTLLDLYPDAKAAVLTATPVGAQGRSLVPGTYGALVEGCKNTELIAQGYLLPTVVSAPSEPNIEGVKIVNKQEYSQGQLSRAVKECTVFADVFGEWEPYSDRKTICFVPGVAYGRDLEKQFNFLLGPGKANLIYAKTPQKERDRILAETAGGQAQILISVDVLREGFDLPELACGIDLQPNRQLRSYWQKIGRIKRPFAGQTEARWLDFAGNYWRFPHPDEDPVWPTGDETTQEVIERLREEGKGVQPISCPACQEVYSPLGRPPTCPHCGHVIDGEPTRRIRMGHGKLKEVPAYEKKKAAKSDEQRLLSKWQSALIRGIRSGLTFGQCAIIFRRETGEYPKQTWPGTFDTGSLAWKRRVNQDLNMRQLYVRCRELSERMA